MAERPYNVFISYRRQGGEALAKLVYNHLIQSGFCPFLDQGHMNSGRFDMTLLRRIEQAPHFICILTPGCLDNTVHLGDWVRLEIAQALATHRNIVPLAVGDFVWPSEKDIPAEIQGLLRIHTASYRSEHREASLEELSRLLGRSPRYGNLARRSKVLFGAATLLSLVACVLAAWGVIASRFEQAESQGLVSGLPHSDAATGTAKTQSIAPLSLHWYGFGQRARDSGWEEFRVQDGTTMYSGDQFRFVFIPIADCYVYMINIDAGGEPSLLFPNSAIHADNRCQAGKLYEIPDGNNWYTLDGQTGSETIYLVASYDPLTDLSKLLRPAESVPQSSDKLLLAIRGLEMATGEGQRTVANERIDVRGVTIAPDERVAGARLANGRESRKVMEYTVGNLHVVKRIEFEHQSANAGGME